MPPDDWVEFSGHQYMYYPDPMITALDSRTACLEHGALLASINSAEEQQFIANNVLSQRTLAAFMGGSDEVTGVLALFIFYFYLFFVLILRRHLA